MLNHNLIYKISQELDIEQAFILLSLYGGFNEERKLMKKIIDNFNKFNKLVYDGINDKLSQKETFDCQYLGKIYTAHCMESIRIIVHPSQIFLEYLREKDFIIDDIDEFKKYTKQEYQNNKKFSLIYQDWDIESDEDYCKLNTYQKFIKYCQKMDDEIIDRERIFVIKEKKTQAIKLPYSVYNFYKKFNVPFVTNEHLLYDPQEDDYILSEFQDYWPLFITHENTYTQHKFAVNCNQDSDKYGKIAAYYDNEEHSTLIDYNLTLEDLINNKINPNVDDEFSVGSLHCDILCELSVNHK